nr:hypothetical protein [Aneurinibacillus terranovensis]
MKETLIFIAIAMSISVSLLIFAWFSFLRYKEQEENVVTIGPESFDAVLWEGKIKEVIHNDAVQTADLDVIVYSKSIFVGFASQGFPFVNINAKDIIRVTYARDSVSIQMRGINGEPTYVKMRGGSEKQLLKLARKAKFISSRAEKGAAAFPPQS